MDHSWRSFCLKKLENYPDVLTVLEIKAITGYCKTSVQGWIDRKLILAVRTRRSNKIPKKLLADFMCSDKFRNMHVKSARLKEMITEFERMSENEN